MSYAGQERTLTREKPGVQEDISQTEEQIETHQKLDRISGFKWLNNMNNVVIFGKPKKEGAIYTGEYVVYYDNFSDIFRYEILSDGEWKINGIKKLFKDGTEQPYIYESIYNINIDEDGKTLVLRNDKVSFILKRITSQTEEEIQTQLWMDEIADVDWESKNSKMRFHKPTREGDVIKGIVEIHLSGDIFHCKYERSPDGQAIVEQTKESNNGATLMGGVPFKMRMLLDNKANTLTTTTEHTTSIYTRN